MCELGCKLATVGMLRTRLAPTLLGVPGQVVRPQFGPHCPFLGTYNLCLAGWLAGRRFAVDCVCPPSCCGSGTQLLSSGMGSTIR